MRAPRSSRCQRQRCGLNKTDVQRRWLPRGSVELGVLGQAACAWVFVDSKELTGPGGPGGQCTKLLVYRLCTSACSQGGSSADLRGTSFGQCTAPVPLAGSGSNPGLTTGAAPAERCGCPGKEILFHLGHEDNGSWPLGWSTCATPDHTQQGRARGPRRNLPDKAFRLHHSLCTRVASSWRNGIPEVGPGSSGESRLHPRRSNRCCTWRSGISGVDLPFREPSGREEGVLATRLRSSVIFGLRLLPSQPSCRANVQKVVGQPGVGVFADITAGHRSCSACHDRVHRYQSTPFQGSRTHRAQNGKGSVHVHERDAVCTSLSPWPRRRSIQDGAVGWVRTDWNPLLLPSSAFVLGDAGKGFAIQVGSEGWGVSKQSQPSTGDRSESRNRRANDSLSGKFRPGRTADTTATHRRGALVTTSSGVAGRSRGGIFPVKSRTLGTVGQHAFSGYLFGPKPQSTVAVTFAVLGTQNGVPE